MTSKTPPKGLKTILEFGPVLGFFAAYLLLKDRIFTIGGTEYAGFIVVTAGFIPVFLLATGVLWKVTGRLSPMQIVTAVLIVVFGGLSVWLNDERFFKMKPTLIYSLFGLALAIGLMRGESWLEKVMEGLMPLEHEGWLILTRRVMWMFFGLALANEVVWRLMETETWVYFKTFGLPVVIMAFFMTQARLIERYTIPEDKA
ncbi:MAG: septation protein IspZ [Pelagimonas sp.]|jgi:intracellular septation protein|nr:septation protein IspZ [Pelagimonas sp.]